MKPESATPNADDGDEATYIEVNRWSDEGFEGRDEDASLDVLLRSEDYEGIETEPSADGGTLATIHVGDHRIQLSEDVVRAAGEKLDGVSVSGKGDEPPSESNTENRGDEIRRISRACERLLDGGESVVTAQQIAEEAGYEEAAKVRWRLSYSDIESSRVELSDESGTDGYRLIEK